MRNNDTDKKVDEIMKNALASEVEPGEELNQRIILRWKEHTNMKKQVARKVYAAAAACGVLMVSVTVGAAVKYLTPEQVAERSGMDQEKIQAAFQSPDAIEINESQEAGDYRFTLMGITTEQGLEESDVSAEINVQGDMYAIVAVEHLDGTPMPDTSEDAYGELAFFMSPLVEGLEPWRYNTVSMGGGYSDFVENGILYRVIASDDISIFADRNLYLCVSDTVFYDTAAYCYDEVTGAITRNEDYEGVNLLFDLPIDGAKADPEKASEYLTNLEADWTQPDESSDEESSIIDSMDAAVKETEALVQEIETQILNGEEEAALKDAELMPELTKTVIEENGTYLYDCVLGEGDSSTLFFCKENFINGKDVMIWYGDFDESTEQFEGIYIHVLTETGDGTAEVRTYYMAF